MALNADSIWLVMWEVITPGNPSAPATMSLVPPVVGKSVVVAANQPAAAALLIADVNAAAPAVVNIVKMEQIPTTDGGYHA